MTIPVTQYYRTIPDHPVVKLLQGDAIALLADLYWHRNGKTGRLDPKLKTLAEYHGWSYWKAQRLMAKLRDGGIIVAEKRRRSSNYVITTPDQWHHPSCRTLRPRRNVAAATREPMTGQMCHGICATAKEPTLKPGFLI